jgi:UDP-N-acetylglucosamine acyltransferase
MIHPTAIVDPAAEIHPGARIGPYCIVGPGVEIGEDTELQHHVTVMGPTKIGCGNFFYAPKAGE